MGVSWMKKGAESAKIAVQNAVEQEAYKESLGKMYRFFMAKNEECRITFVDGDLEDGALLPPRYYEHMVQVHGNWQNHVCPEKTSPEEGHKCPLCAAGDRPALVALFTVIDHREVPSKDGTKIYKDRPRLFVAKPQTMEMLVKIAVKRGGLAGITFDVSRTGEQSAAVGSMFDFVEKTPVDILQTIFTEIKEINGQQQKVSYFVPADYENEIIFRTPSDMLKLGLGAGPSVGGGQMSPGGAAPAGKTNYASKL